MNETFGQRLSRIRKEKGMTQEDIAKRIVISPQAVSKWENDVSSPDILVLSSLADILGVSVDELLGRGEEEVHAKEEPKANKAEEVDQEAVFNDNGIHIKDDEDEVHVTDKGIYIKDKDEASPHKITFPKPERWIPSASIFGLALLGFILMGIFWTDQNMGWKSGWTLLLFAISIDSVFEAVEKRRFCKFIYPVFVTATYCLLGYFGKYFNFPSWDFFWFLFLTIPCYYLIFGPIDSRIHHGLNEDEENQDKE